MATVTAAVLAYLNFVPEFLRWDKYGEDSLSYGWPHGVYTIWTYQKGGSYTVYGTVAEIAFNCYVNLLILFLISISVELVVRRRKTQSSQTTETVDADQIDGEKQNRS